MANKSDRERAKINLDQVLNTISHAKTLKHWSAVPFELPRQLHTITEELMKPKG